MKDDYNPPESTAEQIRKENLGAYAKYLKGEGGLAKLVGTGDAAAAPIDIAAVDLAAVVNNTTDGTIAARSFRNRSLEPRVPNQNVSAPETQRSCNGDADIHARQSALVPSVTPLHSSRFLQTAVTSFCTPAQLADLLPTEESPQTIYAAAPYT